MDEVRDNFGAGYFYPSIPCTGGYIVIVSGIERKDWEARRDAKNNEFIWFEMMTKQEAADIQIYPRLSI
jgi:hypothetical protein